MVDSPRGSRASRRKTPTIYDVAREARVSVFTVSAVINNKSHVGAPLKKRVDAAILKLSYRPIRSPKAWPTNAHVRWV
jgi:LacI family transcriptional regulator